MFSECLHFDHIQRLVKKVTVDLLGAMDIVIR